MLDCLLQVVFIYMYHNIKLTGSGEPLACPGGEFCQTSGLPLPTGLCSSGYYCSLASTTPTPTDGVEGDICPAGFYCEEGTQVPSPCPPGTYSFTTMNVNVSDCLACDLGQYCGAYNLTEPSGEKIKHSQGVS